MLANYLKVAFRNLLKSKTYALINILGLAIGMASCVLILLYVQHGLSYDRQHERADRIYRVYHEYLRDGQVESYAKTPGPLAEFLGNAYAPIEETVRMVPVDKILMSCGDKHFYEESLVLADPSILDVFSFPLIRGNPGTALKDPGSLLITQTAADKYFGDQNPIGKTIRVDRKTDLTVTGILKEIPSNSHIPFDFLASMASVEAIFHDGYLDDKNNTFAYTYVQLGRDIDSGVIPDLLAEAEEKYLGGTWGGTYKLQPITRIHLHSDLGGEYEPNGNIRSIYIMAAIALSVLFVACINYANLAVALYSKRMREIGLRKVMGSNRIQLGVIFLTESFAVAFVALLFAITLVEMAMPWFAQFVGRSLDFSLTNGPLICGLAILVVAVGFLSGTYPALFVSRLQPVDVLKNRWTCGGGKAGLRYGLVLVQFAVFIILMIGTVTIGRQVRYIQNKNLGFIKDGLVVVPLADKSMRQKTDLLKREFLSNPNIRSAAATSDMPGVMRWVTSVSYEGFPPDTQTPTMSFLKVDGDFIETFSVDVVQGRDFSQAGHQYIINEAAVRSLGWEEPLGKWFRSYHGGEGNIVGVIGDFHFKPLHNSIEPLFLSLSAGPFDYLSVRVNAENVQETLSFMEDTWKRLSPDSPFDFFFYDSFFDKLYKNETQFGRMTLLFSALTILIACNGLLGLASFTAEQRTKEIGIRKVLGASVAEIVSLLSKDFSRWVVLANVIAWPIAYWAMSQWLERFAYRVDLGWTVFLASGGVALLVAWLAVGGQAMRAALSDPVEALRYE